MLAITRITRNFRPFLPFVWILALVAACSTGKKSLERGDYDRAIRLAVKKLRSDTDNKKAQATLKEAYPLFLMLRQQNITEAKNSPNPFKWERVVGEYQSINSIHHEIQRCPACLAHIPDPAPVISELNDARLNAAAKRYEMAKKALTDKGSRGSALEAYEHLSKLKELVPQYKDAEELIGEAINRATVHVVVESIPPPQVLSTLDHEYLNNKLNEYLREASINPFVCFYTPEEAEALNLEWIDHRIRMRFDQFSLGNINVNTFTEEVSRDSVLLNPLDEDKVYGKVSAKLTRQEKSILGTALLDFRIIEQETGSVLSQEKFSSEFRWTTQWAGFNGDERALNGEQQRLVKQKEMPVPDPQYIFQELSVPLYEQVVRKINQYYRDY